MFNKPRIRDVARLLLGAGIALCATIQSEVSQASSVSASDSAGPISDDLTSDPLLSSALLPTQTSETAYANVSSSTSSISNNIATAFTALTTTEEEYTRPSTPTGLQNRTSLRWTNATSSSTFSGSALTTTEIATSGNKSLVLSNLTLASSQPLEKTGSGSSYASQCNALWNSWWASPYTPAQPDAFTVTNVSVTSWVAHTTTLGGCDTIPRLVGSFTPTATSYYAATYVSQQDVWGKIPPPECSINPSDCRELSATYDATYGSNPLYPPNHSTYISLAPDLSSVLIGNVTSSLSATGNALPVITFHNSPFPGTRGWYEDINYAVTPPQTLTISQNSWLMTPSAGVLVPGGHVIWQNRDSEAFSASPRCNTMTGGPECGQCQLYGGKVKLLYFPVSTNASRDMCATALPPPTTCPLGSTTRLYKPQTVQGNDGWQNGVYCSNDEDADDQCPYFITNVTTTDSGPSIVISGTTFYENRAYLSLETIVAENWCGTVGSNRAGSLITLASSQLYTVGPVSVPNPCADYGWSLNFADFLPTVPQSAWNAGGCDPGAVNWPQQSIDYANGTQLTPGSLCKTIVDDLYFPHIVVPTEIRNLDPAWLTCAIGLDGLYDPPKALPQATTVAGPSQPTLQATTAASPASTLYSPGPSATSMTTQAPPEVYTATSQAEPVSQISNDDTDSQSDERSPMDQYQSGSALLSSNQISLPRTSADATRTRSIPALSSATITTAGVALSDPRSETGSGSEASPDSGLTGASLSRGTPATTMVAGASGSVSDQMTSSAGSGIAAAIAS